MNSMKKIRKSKQPALFQMKEVKEYPIKQSSSGFKMSKWSAFSYKTKVKCKTHCYRMFWSRHINRFKKGLDKFTDDRPIRGIKHNLMQPLAPKASEPLSWQKRGWHMRGRIILLPRFYMLFPVHSPDALLKTDKPLVWSRMAILIFW